ncbi:MAG: hypothetical protein K2X77_24530 [Candidatus Obscuribacterales bacterium]|jgi:hypothetical protein|nr:hypothetical protein [Candidatus Obscuribacterales bacterium]
MGKPSNYQVGRSKSDRARDRNTIALSAAELSRIDAGARRQAIIDSGLHNAHKTRALEPSKHNLVKRGRADWKKQKQRGDW